MKRTVKFFASSSCGDILYSLPAIYRVCAERDAKAVLYINPGTVHAKRRTVNTYEALYRLLMSQSDVCDAGVRTNETGWTTDGERFNLDDFRGRRNFRQEKIWNMHMHTCGLDSRSFPFPSLAGIEPYSLPVFSSTVAISWSGKYNNHKGHPMQVIHPEKSYCFIGVGEEYRRSGLADVPNVYPVKTDDLLDVTRILAGVEALICDQSAPLVIMQSLGRASDVLLARDHSFTNCITDEETIFG